MDGFEVLHQITPAATSDSKGFCKKMDNYGKHSEPLRLRGGGTPQNPFFFNTPMGYQLNTPIMSMSSVPLPQQPGYFPNVTCQSCPPLMHHPFSNPCGNSPVVIVFQVPHLTEPPKQSQPAIEHKDVQPLAKKSTRKFILKEIADNVDPAACNFEVEVKPVEKFTRKSSFPQKVDNVYPGDGVEVEAREKTFVSNNRKEMISPTHSVSVKGPPSQVDVCQDVFAKAISDQAKSQHQRIAARHGEELPKNWNQLEQQYHKLEQARLEAEKHYYQSISPAKAIVDQAKDQGLRVEQMPNFEAYKQHKRNATKYFKEMKKLFAKIEHLYDFWLQFEAKPTESTLDSVTFSTTGSVSATDVTFQQEGSPNRSGKSDDSDEVLQHLSKLKQAVEHKRGDHHQSIAAAKAISDQAKCQGMHVAQMPNFETFKQHRREAAKHLKEVKRLLAKIERLNDLGLGIQAKAEGVPAEDFNIEHEDTENTTLESDEESSYLDPPSSFTPKRRPPVKCGSAKVAQRRCRLELALRQADKDYCRSIAAAKAIANQAKCQGVHLEDMPNFKTYRQHQISAARHSNNAKKLRAEIEHLNNFGLEIEAKPKKPRRTMTNCECVSDTDEGSTAEEFSGECDDPKESSTAATDSNIEHGNAFPELAGEEYLDPPKFKAKAKECPCVPSATNNIETEGPEIVFLESLRAAYMDLRGVSSFLARGPPPKLFGRLEDSNELFQHYHKLVQAIRRTERDRFQSVAAAKAILDQAKCQGVQVEQMPNYETYKQHQRIAAKHLNYLNTLFAEYHHLNISETEARKSPLHSATITNAQCVPATDPNMEHDSDKVGERLHDLLDCLKAGSRVYYESIKAAREIWDQAKCQGVNVEQMPNFEAFKEHQRQAERCVNSASKIHEEIELKYFGPKVEAKAKESPPHRTIECIAATDFNTEGYDSNEIAARRLKLMQALQQADRNYYESTLAAKAISDQAKCQGVQVEQMPNYDTYKQHQTIAARRLSDIEKLAPEIRHLSNLLAKIQAKAREFPPHSRAITNTECFPANVSPKPVPSQGFSGNCEYDDSNQGVQHLDKLKQAFKQKHIELYQSYLAAKAILEQAICQGLNLDQMPNYETFKQHERNAANYVTEIDKIRAEIERLKNLGLQTQATAKEPIIHSESLPAAASNIRRESPQNISQTSAGDVYLKQQCYSPFLASGLPEHLPATCPDPNESVQHVYKLVQTLQQKQRDHHRSILAAKAISNEAKCQGLQVEQMPNFETYKQHQKNAAKHFKEEIKIFTEIEKLNKFPMAVMKSQCVPASDFKPEHVPPEANLPHVVSPKELPDKCDNTAEVAQKLSKLAAAHQQIQNDIYRNALAAEKICDQARRQGFTLSEMPKSALDAYMQHQETVAKRLEEQMKLFAEMKQLRDSGSRNSVEEAHRHSPKEPPEELYGKCNDKNQLQQRYWKLSRDQEDKHNDFNWSLEKAKEIADGATSLEQMPNFEAYKQHTINAAKHLNEEMKLLAELQRIGDLWRARPVEKSELCLDPDLYCPSVLQGRPEWLWTCYISNLDPQNDYIVALRKAERDYYQSVAAGKAISDQAKSQGLKVEQMPNFKEYEQHVLNAVQHLSEYTQLVDEIDRKMKQCGVPAKGVTPLIKKIKRPTGNFADAQMFRTLAGGVEQKNRDFQRSFFAALGAKDLDNLEFHKKNACKHAAQGSKLATELERWHTAKPVKMQLFREDMDEDANLQMVTQQFQKEKEEREATLDKLRKFQAYRRRKLEQNLKRHGI